jgi:hypothetical protein
MGLRRQRHLRRRHTVGKGFPDLAIHCGHLSVTAAIIIDQAPPLHDLPADAEADL